MTFIFCYICLLVGKGICDWGSKTQMLVFFSFDARNWDSHHWQYNYKISVIANLQLTELDIINLAENICNLKKEEADWLMFFDLVEEGDKLKVSWMAGFWISLSHEFWIHSLNTMQLVKSCWQFWVHLHLCHLAACWASRRRWMQHRVPNTGACLSRGQNMFQLLTWMPKKYRK